MNDRHGTDSDGSPTLWYRIERMDWDNIVFEKRMEYTALVLQSALDVMPAHVHDLNFVLLLDDFPPMQILKHPTIGPAFLKSFVKRCPDDRIKRAVMVTGTTGSVFYNIVKTVTPKSFVDKITVVKNREQAAAHLLDVGIIGSKDEIPSFLGGMAPEHPDEITKNLPRMISSLLEKMQ